MGALQEHLVINVITLEQAACGLTISIETPRSVSPQT